MSLPKIYDYAVGLDHKQIEALNDGGKPAILTPDDILTLKLLWEQYVNHGPDIGYESVRRKQTLERILKQIQ